MNAVLPRDIALKSLGEAPVGFHARHSAIAREYRYGIWNGAERSPMARRTSFAVPDVLDEALMALAAAHLIGDHDFGGFGRPISAGGPTIRSMRRAEVARSGDRIEITFEANAFLRHQVRRTVGFLIDVGRGRLAPEHVLGMLDGSATGREAWRAPARGLVLTQVRYPVDEEITLAAQQAGRRARRDVEDGR